MIQLAECATVIDSRRPTVRPVTYIRRNAVLMLIRMILTGGSAKAERPLSPIPPTLSLASAIVPSGAADERFFSSCWPRRHPYGRMLDEF